ncbi:MULTISPECIES: Bro-N domain-containing protein [unclassified Caballeronia]|uniref:BRO-N domain-containing protein n=1 Tax=unclassified Caballeronia TaxID=2646786 RepID=UPI00285EA269|nr:MULTISPECIES: Bro-N domain-containing protein [unclassified Caballeronia]MDR5777363.1 Bro-N domain-containing protein [Caballeronia sp. LZ002]MDR5802535.1 Bro-N domain-containing protein [Caballeronia sp. LZ001]MDR5852801.1 Bro-N domain-containing protein [Caballeronia sp. LZ003]
MSALNIFQFASDGKKHDVRVVDVDGIQHFVGKDVCDVLSYANASKAMNDHCKGVTNRYPLQTAGGMQELRVLTEADVLRLIVNSRMPAAEKFERWVFEEVLPSIRKTGSYAMPGAQPLSPAQMFLQSAQLMAEIETRQIEQAAAIELVRQQVVDLTETRAFTSCPSNAESITHIRKRIAEEFGLSAKIVDEVIRQSPLAPKPAGEVKNNHEDANGSTYTVWWRKDVTAVFRRFVDECRPVTTAQFEHPYISGRFKVRANAASDEPLAGAGLFGIATTR